VVALRKPGKAGLLKGVQWKYGKRGRKCIRWDLEQRRFHDQKKKNSG